MTKITRALLSAAFLLALSLPVAASADTSSWWCNPQFSSWFNMQGSCGTNANGLSGLAVYVSVLNQYNTAYTPSSFAVSVSGSNVSPSSFPGSISGTPVLMSPGSYSVSLAPNAYASNVSYSSGCSGTLAAGQNALCVITVNPGSAYSNTVVPYVCPQGAYGGCTQRTLSCTVSYSATPSGTQATLTAFGGSGGVYNWMTASRSYLGTGPQISVMLQSLGQQLITVSNDSQIAVCGAGTSAPVSSGTTYVPAYPATITYPSSAGAPSVTATYVPTLPNTGFEPVGAASYAWAAVLLLAAGLALYRPMKYAIAAALGR